MPENATKDTRKITAQSLLIGFFFCDNAGENKREDKPMPAIENYPEACKPSIAKLSKALGVDSKTAYAMLSLEAVLYDLRPSDERVLNMLLEEHQPCG